MRSVMRARLLASIALAFPEKGFPRSVGSFDEEIECLITGRPQVANRKSSLHWTNISSRADSLSEPTRLYAPCQPPCRASASFQSIRIYGGRQLGGFTQMMGKNTLKYLIRRRNAPKTLGLNLALIMLSDFVVILKRRQNRSRKQRGQAND
jgi:hypothetical protein